MEFADFFKKYGLRFLISTVVGVSFFLIYYFVINYSIVGASDGLFISGAVLSAIGTLSIINNLSFFDIFAFSALKMWSHIDKDKYEEIAKMNGRYDYTKTKELKRKENRYVFVSYYISSFLFLLPAVIIVIYIRITIA